MKNFAKACNARDISSSRSLTSHDNNYPVNPNPGVLKALPQSRNVYINDPLPHRLSKAFRRIFLGRIHHSAAPIGSPPEISNPQPRRPSGVCQHIERHHALFLSNRTLLFVDMDQPFSFDWTDDFDYSSFLNLPPDDDVQGGQAG